jgi:tetratricopeptide (TPR) repeat protein
MGDYETAERMLLSIESTYPDHATLGYRLASVRYHAGRFEDSQNTLVGVIAAGNTNGAIYNLLGWSYYRQTQPQKAVEALHRAIELAPEEEANYQDLGKILVAERLLPAALELARKATTAFPDSADAFELQGSIEAKMRQFADAARSYSRAVELDATRPDDLLGLAQAQFSSGNRKQAIDSLESGLKRFPRESRFPVLYASVLVKEAETSGSPVDRRAEEMLRSALALDPTLPGVHYELGKLALNAGRLPEALEHLKKAAALDPRSTETHFALARAYRRAGNRQAAAQQMEIYQKLQRTETPMEMPPSEPETRN